MTTQQAKNKRRGAQFEIDALAWVRAQGLAAERLRLSGKNDEGDLVIHDEGLTYICELKNEQRINLAGYITEAVAEATNYAKARGLDPDAVMPIVIVKRRGRPVGDSYVVTRLSDFLSQ